MNFMLNFENIVKFLVDERKVVDTDASNTRT